MADDAELAFLEAQAGEYDPSAGYAMDEASGGQDEYDPAGAYSPQASIKSESMPESEANSPPLATPDEAEDALESHPAPASVDVSAAPTPSKRPRTVGGFVDESEDEEEEPALQQQAANIALLHASGAAESPQRSFTSTPNNTLSNTHVQSHNAQDQDTVSSSASVTVNELAPSIPSTLANGNTPVPDSTKTGASAQPSTAPVPSTSTASLPKARLPQDRVGILEDRIAEDPRGDIEAWLSLIEEHRRRHKHDDARAVFERFFKLFPTAVGTIHPG